MLTYLTPKIIHPHENGKNPTPNPQRAKSLSLLPWTPPTPPLLLTPIMGMGMGMLCLAFFLIVLQTVLALDPLQDAGHPFIFVDLIWSDIWEYL